MKEEEKKYTIIEGNLLEYPIFSMERSRVNKTTEEYIWAEKDIGGRVISERKFKINCVYGIPNAFDMNIFNAVMRIYVKKSGLYKKNEIHFTIYELIKEINLPLHHGGVVKGVRESLKRMANTSLNFEDAFYEKKERVTKIVHLIVRIEIYEKQKGDRLINMVKVVLDDELVSSVERKYFKLIDFDVYKSLPSGLPRRLYEYLEKKKYRKNQFKIGIKALAQRIPLKTKKITQLKEYIKKANDELIKKGIIDRCEYPKGNMLIYYFKKSERFKQVEKDLFHLERLATTFYESLGQVKIPGELIQEGMAVLQDLIDQGYTKDEVEYALGWAVDNVKDVHSIRILPKVIGQALGEQESKNLIEKREELERRKRADEEKRLESDRERQDKLDKKFRRLSKKEREEIEQIARGNLIKQGTKPEFLLDIVVRTERNRIFEERLK